MKIAFISGNRELLPDAAIPIGILSALKQRSVTVGEHVPDDRYHRETGKTEYGQFQQY